MSEKREYFLLAIIGFIAFFAVWYLASTFVKEIFLPSPQKAFYTIYNLFANFNLLDDLTASIYRITSGFILATLLAIPLGLLIGTNKRVQAFFEPLIAFVRYMPASAFIPVAILWFGIANMQKVFIIFIGVFPYLTLLVADVASNVDKNLIDISKTLNKKNTLRKVVIPASLPGIWDAMRIMFGSAWTFLIIAEIVSATPGLGHMIMQSQRFLKTENIFAGIVLIGILGLITDLLFKYGYKKLFPYAQKVR
ncbi:ABC transporter permease [Candidatus Woesearchaeota archaeon]|nr:ABC transporter permease [Candidatus Woesearchaeota archaeon]